MGDIRITRWVFTYSGDAILQTLVVTSVFFFAGAGGGGQFGRQVQENDHKKSLTQKIKDVSILPVRSHKKMFTHSYCDRISVPGLLVMDHHGNRPGAVAASQLEADNTVGVMLLDFYGPFILLPWREGSSRQKET